MQEVERFYQGISSIYQMVYSGRWEQASQRQGLALQALLARYRPGARRVMDCACGIGTQSLSLAELGYEVYATDISQAELERAQAQAERRRLPISFQQADFRDLSAHPCDFDAVICCDNALPHLLTDSDLLRALSSMRERLAPEGVLVLTMRDFDSARKERATLVPPVLDQGPPLRLLLRLHQWAQDASRYTVRYIVMTEQESGWDSEEHRSVYLALGRERLERLLLEAGFASVEWPPHPVVGDQLTVVAHGPPSQD